MWRIQLLFFYCFYFEQFASRISGMRFCESSAKDNFNVDEIFLKLVNDIVCKVGGFIVLCSIFFYLYV